MAMTNPTILQLLQKADCRYTLVVAQPLIDTKETKPVSIAIDEVNRGLISYERPAELNDLGE